MSTDKPMCGCCDEINAAIKQHRPIIARIIKQPSLFITTRDQRELAESDGLAALWQGLIKFDPMKMKNVDAYLFYVIRQRIIDGLRSRGSDNRYSAKGNEAKNAVRNPKPLSPDFDISSGPEWDEDSLAEPDTRPARLMVLAWHLDEDLPKILKLIGEGFPYTEIAEKLSIPNAAKRVAQLRKYAEQFPDLVYRPDYKFMSGAWVPNEGNKK